MLSGIIPSALRQYNTKNLYSMNTSIMTVLTTEDLKDLIKSCLKEELAVYFANERTNKPAHDLYSQSDLAKILKVSKPTIISWTKKGILIARRLGRRVYYEKDVVDRCLKRFLETGEAKMDLFRAAGNWASKY
jgi:hypothetical protein